MTQPDQNDLADIARELDVVATWSSGNRGAKVQALADKLWDRCGGRPESKVGDPDLATPGPGVRSRTTADVQGAVEVESHGQIADATPTPPAGNPPAPVAPTHEPAPKAPREPKNP